MSDEGFILKGIDNEYGPFETKQEALRFHIDLDTDDVYWIEDLSKSKKLSKSEGN